MGESFLQYHLVFLLAAFAVVRGEKFYSAVIASESSSTKLLVLEFQKHSGQLYLEKKQLYETFTPGLAELSEDFPSIRNQIQTILKKAEDFIPSHKVEETPIVFRATAGIRELFSKTRDEILIEIRNMLQASRFLKVAHPANILYEIDEGSYAWLAANLLLDRLHGSPEDMVATLDLGGNSSQVSFPLTDNMIDQFAQQASWFPVGDNRVSSFTESDYLLGMDSASGAVLSTGLPPEETGTLTLTSPCVKFKEGGHEYNYDGKSYTVNGITDDNGGGDINMEECAANIQNYVRELNLRTYEHLPNYEIRAIRGFFFVLRDAHVIDPVHGGRVSVSKILETATSVCQNPEQNEDQFLCLHLLYAYTLLTEGYKLQPTQEIEVSNIVNLHQINWATGLAYYNIENET